MDSETRQLSIAFSRLYCDPAVFDSFSILHPISFDRVLPFQLRDPVMDDHRLLNAEEAHLTARNDHTRRDVLDAYARCGLLPRKEAIELNGVIDFYGAELFELMGMLYANAGMFRCALRWYRELIQELETKGPKTSSDVESVYASVGYCLYSLGLFAEAISWTKSCIGPRQLADVVCRALIEYEAQPGGGTIRGVERSGTRTRYLVSAFDPAHSNQTTARLTASMKELAPFQEVYLLWIGQEKPAPAIQPDGYPFMAELDGGSLVRHKMNLLFATCGQADELIDMGYVLEARRLLSEAAMLEPNAAMIRDRLKALR